MKKYFYAVVLSALLISSCSEGLHSTQDKFTEVVVNNVQFVQETCSNNNTGRISTDLYWMVYTNNGTFRVDNDGIFAHPEIVGRLVSGDTVQVKYVMFDAPLLGQFRVITDVADVK